MHRLYRKLIYKNIDGYVAVTDINRKIIAMNCKFKFTNIEKDIIIAHECAHIVLKSFSHNLLWEKIFFELLKKVKKKYGRIFNIHYTELITKYNYKLDGKLYGKL